jgi:hypothetical protein
LSTDGTVSARALKESAKAVLQESGEVSTAVLEAAAKRRNDDGAVDAAKARYLARK